MSGGLSSLWDTALFVLCGGVPPFEITFRVQPSCVRVQPRMRGFVLDWAPWTASDSGSYKEDDVLAYMERVLAPRTMGSLWRRLILDVYAAQTADVVRRFAWQGGYVLRIHGGGATGM